MASWLTTTANWLSRHEGEAKGQSRFVDLAPTDQADPAGVYSAALKEATDNPRVMNIALTGPYGSGKSSIIKSFLKSYKRPVLQISLAAFLPEAVSTGGEVSRQEIERSILQQMLYGADAGRLPLSRFKRIQSPGRWSLVTSLFMVLGLVSCWHLIQERDAIIKGDYFLPLALSNAFNLATFLIGGLCAWVIFHHIYIASFGISLKSISLKDIEIAPKAATEESILNRHLDEIIYFFQSTRYDLVIIEDLDRFNNADIFVTLREINSLVNANSGVKRAIRFLYALRDDMFVNTDRTKFFEFIIPVIPIINSSNSIDKMLEQGRRLSLDDRLDPQFLREVSRYLNDLRLIQNIFNEYAIYASNLDTGDEHDLDANKLLAILIYKNVFPSDFENLHRGKGNLADVLRGHDRYIAASEARYTAEISRLGMVLDQNERQLPADMHELRSIYTMAIIEMIPDHFTHVGLDYRNFIPVHTLAGHDRFEEFINATQLILNNQRGQQQPLQIAGLQAKVDPHKTFQQRKEDIGNKSAVFRDATAKTLRELRARLANLRLMMFCEIIRENAGELDELFEGFGESADLARFLVLEGHLDDSYYQYTSLFHSGRLSPNDNKYLIRIRGFINPDPDFQIDNPNEVIVGMRDADFSRNYVLNVRIVDTLLADSSVYGKQKASLLEFMASNFDACEAFLSSYYARGAAVPVLMAALAIKWPGFVQAAIASPASLTHVAHMISHLTDTQLKSLGGKNPIFSEFVSEKLPDILAVGTDIPPERLTALDLEVVDLAAVGAYPGVARLLFDNGLYEISIDNLDFIFYSLLGVSDRERPREHSYTLMLEMASASLLAKVDGHFGDYLERVLLQLPDNCHESVPAILAVIGRGDLEREAVIGFLERQKAVLPTLDGVPIDLHAQLFEMQKIEPAWGNVTAFAQSESYSAEVLTDFLNREPSVKALALQPVTDGEDARQLRAFLIENDALSDRAYAAYVMALPRNFKAFPSTLSPAKTKVLVDQNRIDFSADSLSQLDGNLSLKIAFVKNNLDSFFEIHDKYALGDDFRQSLLEADIDDASRLRIISAMDLNLLSSLPPRAAIIGRILAHSGVSTDNLDPDAARAIILNARPLDIRIKLLNMLHEMLDDQAIREILEASSDPLPDIRPGWGSPKLEKSDVNVAFATWLKARKFISSWKIEEGFFSSSIRLNLHRK